MRKNIGVGEACELLMGLTVKSEYETVSLADAAGRVSAERIKAAIPVPPFNRSPYDGYAFRGADTSGATRENPVVLKITEEIPAGVMPEHEVLPGYAAKILTGAPIPAGADSTIKYELTEFTETTVKLFVPVAPDTDVVYTGTDVPCGAILAEAGTVISAPVAASLAGQGISEVKVYKRPVVTIINTGTELCEAGKPLPPAAVYNSNVYALSGYLKDAGVVPENGGIVQDDPDVIAGKVKDALAYSDMIITTGGASVGDYDWAVTAAEKLGAEVLFWKTDMKPGGAMMAAKLGGKLVLGLSGNPAAAVIGLLRVGMPYIKKLCGREECRYDEITLHMLKSFSKKNEKTRLLRGKLVINDGKAFFEELGSQGSETISSLAGCDLLAEIPAGTGKLESGSLVKAYRI